jgi:nicotinate phosphoribosyltransferase
VFVGWIAFNLLLTVVGMKFYHVPIITSLLDTDWYKFTQNQVVFHQFPEAVAHYEFINRGKTQFPDGFADALKKELKYLSKIELTPDEYYWLEDQLALKSDYLDWLANYNFNPSQVHIKQTGGDLKITIEGLWEETILFEVPLMAIISELYFRMTNQVITDNSPYEKIATKGKALDDAGVNWIDFGTRRRYSKEIQDAVDRTMYDFKHFLGTSNPYFAMMYDLKPVGTFAHETLMAMQAKYSATEANRKWMEYWHEEYSNRNHMLIALTDTLTTEVFFRDFNKNLAEKFAGVRQDSGDPFEFGQKMIDHYKKLGINPKTKNIVFSDSLNTDKAIRLQERFGNEIKCVMGIGTDLSNDCGFKPLNMVIKLTAIDFGNGFKNVVKLSDDAGKHTGDPTTIAAVKKELNL